jgi:hypothetical protein
MDSKSQTHPPPRNYLKALLKGLEGNQTKPEQAETASVQDPELCEFLSQLKKETPLPTPESLQEVSDKLDKNDLELSDLESDIRKLKAHLQQLKEKRNPLREKVNSDALLLHMSRFLTEQSIIDANSFQWLHDHLIGPDLQSVGVDTTRDGYKVCIGIYMMIFSKSPHQENKDRSCFQLALHALRIGDVQRAKLFSSLILDDEIKREYEYREQIRSY